MEQTLPAKAPSLNPGQQSVFDTLIDYLLNRESPWLWWLVKGYAGTGKTFTISNIIHYIRTLEKKDQLDGKLHKRPLRIVLSAPTHKAVKVLRKGGSRDVEYATIHSLYGLKPQTDEHGVQRFVQSYNEDSLLLIECYDVLILDEVSMLNHELFEYIKKSMEKDGLKVIFLGDPVQIPPVETNKSTPEERAGDSVVLSNPEKYGIGVLELTQVVRQAADNPILAYATELRKVYKNGVAHPSQFASTQGESGLKLLTSEDEVEEVLTKYFTHPSFQEDADYMKVISWTNKVVDTMNARIRRILYGEEHKEPIIVGEKLVMDAPYELNRTTGERLKTNDELQVVNVAITTREIVTDVWGTRIDTMGNTVSALRKVTYKIACYALQVRYEDTEFTMRTATIPVIHPNGRADYDRALTELKQSAMYNCPPDPHNKREAWKRFYKFKENFAAVKYNYAITAHKSQGSTYQNVLSIEGDINKNRKVEERNRIKYVAATRAKHMLYIVK